ncbi:MAG: hypothetical protein WDM87_07690 [Terracidiphilus sp.]
MVFSERVDQVGCGNALGDAVAPAARFHKVIEEQRDDVVGLDECSVAVDDAEAVRVTVGGDGPGPRRTPSSFFFASPSRWSSGSGAWPLKSTSR